MLRSECRPILPTYQFSSPQPYKVCHFPKESSLEVPRWLLGVVGP